MRVCFFRSSKPREGLLADAFIEGVNRRGDDGSIRIITEEMMADCRTDGVKPDCDVAVMLGVKSIDLWYAYRDAGVATIMVDKGYLRHGSKGPIKMTEFFRVAVGAHQPTNYIMDMDVPKDRFQHWGQLPQPWKENGKTILVAGSSAKYHEFHNLPEPTEYYTRIIRKLRKNTDREIIYKPKPSWTDATPIEGSTFAFRGGEAGIEKHLENAHVLITHGSNACFDAMMAGVPSIILGEAVAKPLCSTDIDEVEDPKRVPMRDRRRWLGNLAYCQWTLPEFATGQAWRTIRPLLFR